MSKSSFFYGLGVGIILTSFIFYGILIINENYTDGIHIEENSQIDDSFENEFSKSDDTVDYNEEVDNINEINEVDNSASSINE